MCGLSHKMSETWQQLIVSFPVISVLIIIKFIKIDIFNRYIWTQPWIYSKLLRKPSHLKISYKNWAWINNYVHFFMWVISNHACLNWVQDFARDQSFYAEIVQKLITLVFPEIEVLWIHYNGAIIDAMSYQITGISIVGSTIYSGADQRKHQSFASLAFVRGIRRWPVVSPHKGPVIRKMFPFDGVIMI